MKTLLIFLAILLIAAGVAVGLMNIFSPGTVIVGLNLDVAATLFTGGCVLLGLGVVAGNLSTMNAPVAGEDGADDYGPSVSEKSDLPDFMAPAPVSAAAAASAAAAGSTAFGDAPGDTAEAVADVADDVAEASEVAVDEAADSIFGSVRETASEVAGDVAEKTDQARDKARDDLSSFFAKAPEDDPDPDADTPPVFTRAPDRTAVSEAATASDEKPEAKHVSAESRPGTVDNLSGNSGKSTAEAEASRADAPAADTVKEDTAGRDTSVSDGPKFKPFAAEKPSVGTQDQQLDTADAETDDAGSAADDAESVTDDAPEALPQEEELFVVEERVIRERPARLLSDGTVEAETDEGWMRFENVEHVEEYLDAMKATA